LRRRIRIIELQRAIKPDEYITEVTIMALSNLYGWKNGAGNSAAYGTACGAGDSPEAKPAACGTACGAGDK